MRMKGKGLAAQANTGLSAVDPIRFDEFYRKYFVPLVRRATWKHGLDKEDARDVVQEAFMVALLKLDPQRNPKAWLIQVVDHLSANFHRKLIRRAKLVSTWCRADIPQASTVLHDGEALDETGPAGGEYY
jgi:DNA-directed RNA polymerase specialized sigma24 family protein